MTDHEAVLRDLLLECGIEGVTLWHIRALAAYFYGLRVCGTRYHPVNRLDSDLRGEDAVLAEAHAENMERDARERFRGAEAEYAVIDELSSIDDDIRDLDPDQFGGSDYGEFHEDPWPVD